jgi:hypothetical protein
MPSQVDDLGGGLELIPKTIHYIWFGGNPLGEKELAYIESWKKYCPDYEIVRWDETNFDVSQNRYCREAYEAKKWAFVSDYARLWILVHHGGIYMDTDVEVVKPLDAFLAHEAFSGFEKIDSIPTGIMASRAGFPLFENLLHDYDERSFVMEDGSLDETTNVVAITQACLDLGFKADNTFQIVDGFALYPKEWFCPKNIDTGVIESTSNTHTIHHFRGSWVDSAEREVASIKHGIIARHPGINEMLAAIIARARYGLVHGDPKPFLRSIKKNLTIKRKDNN